MLAPTANAKPDAADAPALPESVAALFPAAVHPMLRLGHARLMDYQGANYAALYVQRLQAVWAAEQSGASGHSRATEGETGVDPACGVVCSLPRLSDSRRMMQTHEQSLQLQLMLFLVMALTVAISSQLTTLSALLSRRPCRVARCSAWPVLGALVAAADCPVRSDQVPTWLQQPGVDVGAVVSKLQWAAPARVGAPAPTPVRAGQCASMRRLTAHLCTPLLAERSEAHVQFLAHAMGAPLCSAADRAAQLALLRSTFRSLWRLPWENRHREVSWRLVVNGVVAAGGHDIHPAGCLPLRLWLADVRCRPLVGAR